MVNSKIYSFLQHFCSTSNPVLLALSGGPDSLYLFYCLLAYREQEGLIFHVAHVDHGWRKESQMEALTLQQLALQHQVPFHLKKIDSSTLEGNLEAACREERYAFFSQLYKQYHFQAVLTGHHQGDQAETVLKRLLEGSSWLHWNGLKAESWIKEARILRPLLTLSKQTIQQALAQENIQAFHDSTNEDSRFLRSRMRQTIFPWLAQQFGKEIQPNLIKISEEAQELIDYFHTRLNPLLETSIKGPWGEYLDLQMTLPQTQLEIKYLLRLLAMQKGFFLSRSIIEKASLALQNGQANQLFVMGKQQLRIDRKRLFIPNTSFVVIEHPSSFKLASGVQQWGYWKIEVNEQVYQHSYQPTSWKEGWQGYLTSYLPIAEYSLGIPSRNHINWKSLKKGWNEEKIPAFLYFNFPLVWQENGIYQEFLTGHLPIKLKEGQACWQIQLTYFKEIS